MNPSSDYFETTNYLFRAVLLFVLIGFMAGVAMASDMRPVHHDIVADIRPSDHLISVQDTIRVPEGFPGEFSFLLHKGMAAHIEGKGARLRREKGNNPMADTYSVSLSPGTRSFTVRYRGLIYHPVRPVGREQARGFSASPGIISEEGVYLGGESLWYPAFGSYVSFSLRVSVPRGWDSISQGARTFHERGGGKTVAAWESSEQQEEIYLVAGRYHEYSRPGPVSVMAFLQKPDPGLAGRYLEAASRYIGMYSDLIGPYPYSKFALVENFWETGFGMPSFTLLGPAVIRLPFIINTSYPHEILHNWWGNGVYPDLAKGNWTEGLTAYLSDHLVREQQGEGAEYRQTTLQKYADYVSGGRDFPLTEFRSRHSQSTEAIGYGKSLMFFHMLRLSMGDGPFIRGLREFYGANLFRRASFDDLKTSLSAAAAKSLDAEFKQWVGRTGAPVLKITDAADAPDGAGHMLSFSLRQAQAGDAYNLHLPVAVTVEGKQQAEQFTLNITQRDTRVLLHLPGRPLRVDVDPEFDVFRRLDREEVPPAISGVLGAKKVMVVLPSSAGKQLLDGLRGLAEALAASGPDIVEIKTDAEVKEMPEDGAVVVLGWENRFAYGIWPLFSDYNVAFHDPNIMIGAGRYSRQRQAVVLTARRPGEKGQPVLFIASDDASMLPGLARKLPHYHKYSYLVFEGAGPDNIAKGRWPVLHSPLTVFLPGEDGSIRKVAMAGLAPRKALVLPVRTFSKERMAGDIGFLASEGLEGRGLGTRGIEAAAAFISAAFRDGGLLPAGESGYLQTWEEEAKEGDTGQLLRLSNVAGLIKGKDPVLRDKCVIVGAHYDHLGRGWPGGLSEYRGKIHPGADDNASGVAVLLELARHLANGPAPDRSIVFAAFTGEEAGRLGSRRFIRSGLPFPVKDCIGMINLDTVGRLGKKRLIAIGTESAPEWPHVLRGAGYAAGVEIEAVTQPLEGGDQVGFTEAGVPAIQFFSGPHIDYHRPSDTPEKIDADGLIRVASAAKEVIEHLASRKEPLTFSAAASGEAKQGRVRSVSIGTVPDFGYKGRGVRLSGTVPGSPAESAGLKEGDIVIRLDGRVVENIRDLSAILKTLMPGSRTKITFLRADKEIVSEVEVKAR